MKKKVLIVNSFYFPDVVGGAEISTQVLAEKLNENFDVSILTSTDDNGHVKTDIVNGINVYRIPNFNIYSDLNKNNPNSFEKIYWHYKNLFNKKKKTEIQNIIRKIKPDIIHTQNLNGIGTEIWKIGKLNDATIIHTLRDYQLKNPTKISLINQIISFVNRRRSKDVDWIVGISKYILNEFIQSKFFKKASDKVIYNTINNKTIERTNSDMSKPLKVGYIGRLELEKGIEFFLESTSNMSNDIIGQIVVVGTGSIEKELVEKYKGNHVDFRGKLDFESTQEVMSQLDIIVVPSLWPEPFGRVVIEAYRQGTPVIGTNKGGIPEIIINSEMLIEANDQADLQKKITKIYELNQNDYRELRRDCLNYSKEFTNTHEEYKALYKVLTREISGN